MEKFNVVELINDDSVLFAKGIKKGNIGILLEQGQNNECAVMFFNYQNIGEYALCTAKKIDLKILCDTPEKYKADIENLLKNPGILKKIEFEKSSIKEYDLVELIIDRSEYSKLGVQKGMRGCVMNDYAVKGKRQVIFSENGTGKDIAEIAVREEDLRVIE